MRAGGALALALLLCVGVACGWQEWTWKGAGPGPRSGHTLLTFRDSIILFGGRGSDQRREHRPKTYETQEIDGVASFKTYDQKLVKDCGNDTTLACLNITIGLYFNDVWQYPLGGCRGAGSSACVVPIAVPLLCRCRCGRTPRRARAIARRSCRLHTM
jgi:hypothetical protein